MILKRLEKNGKIKAMYASATVVASTYDTTTKDLIVIFNNGGQYKYPSVAATDYMRFETAESTGSDFNTHIKKKYTNFEKMDKISEEVMKAIITEITELKAAENKATTDGGSKTIVELMNVIVGAYISKGTIDADLLGKLQTRMTSYLKAATPTTAQPATATVVA